MKGRAEFKDLYRQLTIDEVVWLGLGEVLLGPNRWYSRSLPTEFVFRTPGEAYQMDVARGFGTQLYVYGEKLMDYDELRRTPGFTGTSGADGVILSEIWEDYGSDGHTEYRMQGWILMEAKTWERLAKLPIHGRWPDLRGDVG